LRFQQAEDGGCADLNKASSLGSKEATQMIKQYCK